MGFASDSGYTPADIPAILSALKDGVNTQFGTTYTDESFIGSNHYKFYYTLAQRIQQNEVKTSEIFAYLEQYFETTNERIDRPVATNPGLIEALARSAFIASVKPMVLADAGKISVCVDVNDGTHASGTITITSYANLVSGSADVVTVNGTAFTAQAGSATPGTGTFQAATSNNATATSLAAQINAHATASLVVRASAIAAVVTIKAVNGGTAGNALTLGYTDNDTNVGATKSGTVLSGGVASSTYAANKLAINTIIKNSVVAGVVSQGTQTSTIVLTNGQSFDFKFYLPNRIDVLLRLTTTLSINNQVVISSPDDVKQVLIANIAARYHLGKNFEPQKYFTTNDAPWTSQVLLEWSIDNGGSYNSTVYTAAFDDLFNVQLANITVVEA